MFFKNFQNVKDGNKSEKRTKNILPKIMSVLAAIVLWIYVVDTRTTVEEKIIAGVEIELENISALGELTIVSGNDYTVDVTVSGTKKDISKISKEDIDVTADVSVISEPGSKNVKLNIKTPKGVTVVNKSTSEVSVTVDKTITKNVNVDVEFLYDKLDINKYELGDVTAIPGTVQITGPQSLVDDIYNVEVVIDESEIDHTFTSKSTVFPFDNKGNEVSNPYIKLNPSSVSVKIPVYKKMKVRVSPTFENFVIYNYDCDVSPEYVLIKSETADFEKIDSIKTELIFTDAALGKTVEAALELPDDVIAYTVDGEEVIEKVNVTLNEVTKKQVVVVPDFEVTDTTSEENNTDESVAVDSQQEDLVEESENA